MTDILTRLAASDPLRDTARPELDTNSAALLATPRDPARPRSRRRGRAILAMAALLAVTATAAAAGGVDWDRVLPGSGPPSSQPRPVVDAPAM